ALRYRLPAAQVPALACLGIGYLVAYLLVSGQVTATAVEDGQLLLRQMFCPESGGALIPLVLFLVALSEWLVRRSRQVDGVFQAAAAGVMAAVSLVLVMLDFPATPARAALACGVYGTAGLLLNARWRRPLLSYAAALVLFGCAVATLHAWTPDL